MTEIRHKKIFGHALNPLRFSVDLDGYKQLSNASYRILLFNWMIYCFLLANSFSGCILAFMNVRIRDQGVDTVIALETALQSEVITGGTLENSAWLAMIEVSTTLN